VADLAADYHDLSVLGFPQFTLFFNRIYIRKLRLAHSEPLYQLSYLGKICRANFSPPRCLEEKK